MISSYTRPLLLDITFIHEGNKTFHDNLVNFEKLVSCLCVCVSKPNDPMSEVTLSLEAVCHINRWLIKLSPEW